MLGDLKTGVAFCILPGAELRQKVSFCFKRVATSAGSHLIGLIVSKVKLFKTLPDGQNANN